MRARSAARFVVAFVVVAPLLAACSAVPVGDAGTSALDRSPVRVDAAAPPATLQGVQAPRPLDTRSLVDPGWSAVPHELDGVFLGLREHDDHLRFSAVDADGVVLWTAERPLTCSGFALSTDGERPVAVLTDVTAGEANVTVTTATGYDLRSGEKLWGPVEVPGPHHGPGLVFARPAAGVMGPAGPRLALDPRSGRIAATEEGHHNTAILGEHLGTIVRRDDDDLVAQDASSGRELWRVPTAALGVAPAEPLHAAPDTTPGPDVALVGNHGDSSTLVDLRDGSVVVAGADDAATDPTTGTRVVVTSDRMLAYDPSGRRLWDREVSGQFRISAAGEGVVHLRSADEVTVHDLNTGEPLDAYGAPDGGAAAVPLVVSAAGAVALDTGSQVLLATAEPSGR